MFLMQRTGKGLKIVGLVFAIYAYVLMIIGAVFKNPPYESSLWALAIYIGISLGIVGLLMGIFGQERYKDSFGWLPIILSSWVIVFSIAFLVISSLI